MDLINDTPLSLPNDRHSAPDSLASRRRPSRQPTADDLVSARAILNGAPIGARPVDVALYFAALEDRNTRGHFFNAQWPADYALNPIIAEFQSVVGAMPGRPASLDLVGWSAAFVNWCLQRAGYRGTQCGDAASFRSLMVADALPMRGDIAVFGDVDASGRLMNTGHVGFWLQDYGDTIQVVAANHRHDRGDRVSQAPVSRVRIDPRGRISRLLLGVVPVAAMQQIT